METNLVVGLIAKCALCVWDIGHTWVPAVGQLADHRQTQYGLPSLCCGGLGAGSAARQWTCEPRCRLWKAKHVWRGACLPFLPRPASCGAGATTQPTRATQAARSIRGRRWQIKSSHHCSGGGQCCLSWVARVAGSGLAFLTTISVILVTNHVANGRQLHGQTIPRLDMTSSQMLQVRVTCSSSNALWPASRCCVPSSPP